MAKRAQLPVRGVCGAGHVVNELAPPGRVTWRGVCPVEACGLGVVARRIPTEQRPDELDEPSKPGSRRVRKVKHYDDEPTPGFDDPDPELELEDDDDRGGGGSTDAGLQPADDEDDEDELEEPAGPSEPVPDGEPTRRRRRRWRGRHPSVVEQLGELAHEREWVIPGIY